jgi:hypothetical protein
MASKTIHRMMGMAVSVAAVAALAGAPLGFAKVAKPAVVPADTAIVNAGISVNAQNPSDNVHEVAKNVDPSNHQISSTHPNTTADFVIYLSGVSSNNGNNFTAPITANYHTQSNGSTSHFTATSGSFTFANKYATQYKIISIPVQYDAGLFAEPRGSFTSFNFVIGSATNASIGVSSAIVYIVNGSGTGNAPGT